MSLTSKINQTRSLNANTGINAEYGQSSKSILNKNTIKALPLNHIHNDNSPFYQFRSIVANSKFFINSKLDKSKKLRIKYEIKSSSKTFKKMSFQGIGMTGFNKTNMMASTINSTSRTGYSPIIYKQKLLITEFSNFDLRNSMKDNNYLKSKFNFKKRTNNSDESNRIKPDDEHSNHDTIINNLRRENQERKETINIQNSLSMIRKSPEIIIRKTRKEEKLILTRRKDFKVNYDPDWYLKNGIPEIIITKKIACDLDFQFNIINDEFKVILENIIKYKITCLNSNILKYAFESQERNLQVKLNMLIEETCGLMLTISNRILVDFAQYLSKFVAIQQPNPTKLSSKIVKDEQQTFISNVGFFNDISAFFKSYHDVYSTLVKQVDDMILPYNELTMILQYLSRLRLNISNLLFTSNNYIKKYKFDQRLVEKFAKNSVLNKVYDKKGKETKAKIFKPNRVDLGDIEKYQSNNQIKETSDRVRRLNIVLNTKYNDADDSFELKKKKLRKKLVKNNGLNSKIVDKLLKYCPKDVRQKIMSERIMSNHRIRNYKDENE